MKPFLVGSKDIEDELYVAIYTPEIDIALPVMQTLLEICAQDTKWGEDRIMSGHVWNTILSEEVGEVARAVLENDKNNLRDELVQVAALSLNMIKALDRDQVTLGY